MIVGLDRCPAGRCFEEIDEAVRAAGYANVVFNAHVAPDEVPDGSIVYNFENIGTNGVTTESFRGHKLWDFSLRNCATWGAAGRTVRHQPAEYWPYKRTCKSLEVQDIDVAHVGAINDRRWAVLSALMGAGLRVACLNGVYGTERDAILSRARLVVVPLYYPNGVFCSLRRAYLVHNHIFALYETAPETPEHVPQCSYDELVPRALEMLK